MPEHNIIQAPEIIGRLTRALGIRQAHVLPTMSETVTPVVLIADVSQQPGGSTGYASFRGGTSQQAAGANVFVVAFLTNPAGSGVLARVRAIEVSVPNFGIYGIEPFVSDPGGAPQIQTDGVDAPLLGSFSRCKVFGNIGPASFVPNTFWGTWQFPSNSVQFIRPSNIVIPPGLTLAIGSSFGITVGLNFLCTFEWDEFPPATPAGL